MSRNLSLLPYQSSTPVYTRSLLLTFTPLWKLSFGFYIYRHTQPYLVFHSLTTHSRCTDYRAMLHSTNGVNMQNMSYYYYYRKEKEIKVDTNVVVLILFTLSISFIVITTTFALWPSFVTSWSEPNTTITCAVVKVSLYWRALLPSRKIFLSLAFETPSFSSLGFTQNSLAPEPTLR
jgi:hypothetical protein